MKIKTQIALPFFASWLWILLEKVFVVGVGLSSNYFVAQNLGVNQFGSLQASLSFIFIIGSFFLLLNSQGVTPIFAKYNHAWIKLILTVFSVRMVCSIVCYGCIVGFYYFDFISEYVLILGLMVFSEAFAIAGVVYYCQNKVFVVSLARALGGAARVFWLYYFTKHSTDHLWLFAWPLEALLGAALPCFALLKKYSIKLPANRKVLHKQSCYLIKLCAGFLPSVVLATVSARFDRLFLSYFVQPEVLGVYSAAAVMVDQWFAVVLLMVTVLQGGVVYKRRFGSLERSAIYSSLFVFVICFIVYLFSLVFFDWFFIMIYGSKFSGGVSIGLFGIFSVCFQGLDLGLSSIFYARKNGVFLFVKNILVVFLGAALFFAAQENLRLYVFYFASIVVPSLFWMFYFVFGNRNETGFRRE